MMPFSFIKSTALPDYPFSFIEPQEDSHAHAGEKIIHECKSFDFDQIIPFKLRIDQNIPTSDYPHKLTLSHR